MPSTPSSAAMWSLRRVSWPPTIKWTTTAFRARTSATPPSIAASPALLGRWNGEVLVHIGQQRSPLFDLHILPMLDQANGPKQYRQGDRGSHLAFTFLAFSSAQSHSRITHDQVFQSQVQFTALTHHAGFLCVRDRAYRLRPGLAHRCISDFQVFVKHQIYGVIIVGGLRAQVLGKLQLH